ncbi:MAG TPA: alkaline phosphatase family protein [Vicinamibacterales bacterium]|nr:alkaline phosphatase family protein [Vicinamibacterales bacterium]
MYISIPRLATGAFACAALVLTTGAHPLAGPSGDHDVSKDVQHVLLISIDGMHALDYLNCVKNETCPNLAELGETGVNYRRTSTARPSDSAPGLAAIVSGGSPKTTGIYYDVAYDRVLAPPAKDTGNGLVHGNCNPGSINGTQIEYEEGVDIDQSQLNGGGPYGPFDGGYLSIDSNKLPRDPFSNPPCQVVWPWNFIRVNTIYGVIHGAGGRTAWSDKHAVYANVSGPTGSSVPSNVDDYYSPDVNSNVIPLPGVTTATGTHCDPIPDTNPAVAAWVDSFKEIQCYDQLKVNAVVNWINGKDHTGTMTAPSVPNIFGMNFQAVSVGQKLIEGGTLKGGYIDNEGTPTTPMLSEIKFVDAAIGQMVHALKKQGLLESTAIIITAKHGQSPIDTHKFFPIPGHSKANGTDPATLLGTNFLPVAETSGLGATADDVALLWLKDSGTTEDAVDVLEQNLTAAGIGQIFSGPSLAALYDTPGIPQQFGGFGGDPRTPDIIVSPNVGVIYTGSTTKQSEHGGFAQDDTNVMLLVSHPDLKRSSINSFVETSQVAPTILKLLGLDPSSLDAVRKEGTPVLPGLGLGR